MWVYVKTMLKIILWNLRSTDYHFLNRRFDHGRRLGLIFKKQASCGPPAILLCRWQTITPLGQEQSEFLLYFCWCPVRCVPTATDDRLWWMGLHQLLRLLWRKSHRQVKALLVRDCWIQPDKWMQNETWAPRAPRNLHDTQQKLPGDMNWSQHLENLTFESWELNSPGCCGSNPPPRILQPLPFAPPSPSFASRPPQLHA